MNPSTRIALLAALVAPFAASAIGCSPPGAVNERAVLDSTPHSEPAEYAKSQEDYNQHMIDRYTGGSKAQSIPAAKKKVRGR